MSDGVVGLIIGFIVGFLICVLVSMPISVSNKIEYYKQGQTDALSGNKIEYCLRKNEVDEKVWMPCKEAK